MVLFVVGLAVGVGLSGVLLAGWLWWPGRLRPMTAGEHERRLLALNERFSAQAGLFEEHTRGREAVFAEQAERERSRALALERENAGLTAALDRVHAEAEADRVEAHRAAVVLLGMHPELEDLAVFGKRILPVLPQRKALPVGTVVDGEANGRSRVRDGSGRFVKAGSS